MKVSIITEGNNGLGLGHIIRCYSIYQAFEDEGIDAQLIVNGDTNLSSLLASTNYQIFNWLEDETRLFKSIKKSTAVVLDSYLAPESVYKKISQEINIPVFLDDNQRIKYPQGVVINRTINAKNFKYSKNRKNVYLLGTKYLPLTKAFWYVPKKQINKRVRTILVTFGGSDPKEATPQITNFLQKEYPKLLKVVIIGKGFRNLEQVRKLKDLKTQVYYFPTGETMKQMMLDVDVAISAGGQTLYELARVGVPTIAIKIVDNQKDNLKGLAEAGFIEYAGNYNSKKLFVNLKRGVDKLEDYELRINKNRIGRTLVDGYGSIRIANFVLGMNSKFKRKN